MWEFRVFYESDFREKLPNFLDFDNIESEERTDYYYDFGQRQFGLKERLNKSNRAIKPKLELKVRYDKSDRGIEYWNKVLSYEYPNTQLDHLPMFEIEEILVSEIEKKHENSTDVEYFYLNQNSEFDITEVRKRRWEIETMIENEVICFEYVEISINNHKFYGFSIESEDLKLIERVIDRYHIDNYQISGGYPTLINAINNIAKLSSFIQN